MKYVPVSNVKSLNSTDAVQQKRLVAIKSVPDTNAPKVEFDNLTELRGCLSEHTRIMVNLATMLEYSEHGGTMHHIVYELAAYDLNKFLTLPRHSSRQFRHDSASPERTRSKDMWPGDLIQESRNLADALDFLHNRLYDKWGGSISLSHNDIRPENILVFYPDSKDTWDRYPVGKWKFADFGLSRVKPRKWARNKHLSVDSAATNLLEVDPTHRDELSTSVSNTTPVRDPGRYTAPELDQKIDPLSQIKKKEDGRRADLWSLGCVLSEVITYAVKLDSRRVEVFRKELGEPNLPNRRFYDHLTKDVKIQLLSHLDSLPNVALGDKRSTNDLWIRSSIELVKEIVVKDPRQRLQAGEIRDKLGKIDHSMRHDKEFWLERSLAIDTTHMNGNHSPSPARSNGSATSSPEDMDMESLSQTPSINLFPAGQSKSVPIMKARTSMASMERRRQTSPAELNGGSARSSIMSQVSPKIHRRGRESR
jgi:serine/threonine protein kinase